jgi:hypothetical protein
MYRCVHHVFLRHFMVHIVRHHVVLMEILVQRYWLRLGMRIIDVEQIIDLVEAKRPVHVRQLVRLITVYHRVL